MSLTRSKRIHKLGNAVRALRGGPYTLPQKKALARVIRWQDRVAHFARLKVSGLKVEVESER